MAKNIVIERLVQSAVDRCRERITSATRRIDLGPNRSGETGIQREPPRFTDALKRLRGL
ncbi:MAG: hypothetical protein LUQ32_10580 [Methanomicrobiales archaeon]|nr:hypothetical protein [Methanomicrobiales archaeon]